MKTEKGYVSFSENSDSFLDEEGNEIEGEKYLLIDLVFVKPEFRGKGIARELLENTIEELKKQNMQIKIVALPKEKDIDQERLVSFYESVGFSISEEQGCSGVIMEM